MVAEGSVVIEFTKEEVEALHDMLFTSCMYTTSKDITYGSRLSATNKIFKAQEKLDGPGKATIRFKSSTKG